MYSYEGLNHILKQNNLKKSNLTALLNISSRTLAKMNKGQKVSNHVIQKICEHFKCNADDIYTIVSDNHFLQRLREEKEHKISGGIYHELQIRMTYNSNHMEGSKLSEDQTRHIFETHTISTDETLPVDDIIETVNHFKAIDYCIDIAEEPLNEDIIKHLHLILKSGTKDASLSWFQVGDYKRKPNIVGGLETTHPTQVKESIQILLDNYHQKTNISFEDIIEFQYQFEIIHPFQDGNGRVGRLIAFKECLKHNITPFIIEDIKKHFYYRGLNEWKRQRGYLIDTCLDGQDQVKKLLNLFEITQTSDEKVKKISNKLIKKNLRVYKKLSK